MSGKYAQYSNLMRKYGAGKKYFLLFFEKNTTENTVNN